MKVKVVTNILEANDRIAAENKKKFEPEHAHILAGAGRADSLVVNPHKWLFTPLDLSAFFCRRMDVLRQAFALVPDYLKTPDAARNLMDTGIQLGRRFRALKLWMILRSFGAAGVRDRLRHHIDLAREFAGWVAAHPDFERLAPHLELVLMLLGEAVYEPGCQLQHAYFPTTAIVSLLYNLESGLSTEFAGVGNEGVLGISLFMGGDTTPSSAVVQTSGHGYRLPGKLLKDEFSRAGLFQRLLQRYTQALMTQMCQTAACNRHHSIEQQLCRWLLLTLDRLPSNELVVTQELVAFALGVRRESITEAAGNLQRAGLIRYRRGHIAELEQGYEIGRCEKYEFFTSPCPVLSCRGVNG